MPGKSSYRRSRDYSKQFDWTYNLKKDVYNCYLKDRVHEKIKKILGWTSFRTEKNKIVLATECETVTTNIFENVTLNEDNCLENNNITNNDDSSIDQSFLSLNPSQEVLLEILRPTFQHNCETNKD